MAIRDLEIFVVRVNPRGNWFFLRVIGDGEAGLGEASHACGFTRASDEDDDRTAAEIRRLFSTVAGEPSTGRALDRLEAAHRAEAADGGLLKQTAYSGLEQALCDLAAREAGLPLCDWLGGRVRDRIPVYANINRACSRRDPADFAEKASQAVAEGFRAVKAAVFDDMPAAPPELGIERLQAMRVALGPDVRLMVDCHSRFSVQQAIDVARRLEPVELAWYEEPVDPEDIAANQAIRRAIRQPMAGGEMLFGVEGFEEIAQAGVFATIMPDVKHCGGQREGRRIARMAAEYGLAVSPHNPSGPVSMAHSAHWACSTPNCPILEHAWGEADWRPELLDPPEVFDDGALAVSDRPGIGCELRLPPAARRL